MATPTLVPLTPERVDDWLAFFDGPAFADHPEWGACYCRCQVFEPKGWEAWEASCANGDENRVFMAQAIRDGRVDGLLAYDEGRVVGWLHFGPSQRFESAGGRLQGAEAGRAAVVCFLVLPAYRRTGLARAMLRASLDELRARGFAEVMARSLADTEAEAADQFTGPLGLYLSEGFVAAGQDAHRMLLLRAL